MRAGYAVPTSEDEQSLANGELPFDHISLDKISKRRRLATENTLTEPGIIAFDH